jgi:sugar/nucleoside kinase (ribokinase family)
VTDALDVLVVGGTGVDHIVRVPLLPFPVRDSMTVPPIQSVVGHTGTGVALGCAALGLRTALVDVIGDDVEGRLVQDLFASAGVELATVTHPSGTRRAVNLVTPDGSRMSLYDPRPPVDLGGDASLWRGAVDRSRHVHVTIMGWASSALADAVTAGRTTSTDLHDWDGENPHHRPFALGADLVFLSAAALGPEAGAVAAHVLSEGRAEAVVVTDGARGSTVYRRDVDPLTVPAVGLPGRPPVDSNGAGDAYAAAYLFSWLAGASHADAARAGSVAGAWACGSPGTHTGLIDEPTLRGLIG